MRPLYLEFGGINSFSERACVNFEELLEYGLFGIFGDTGSGKSTILDCIGFALYGNVSRSRSGSIAEIINYNCDRAFVNFECEIEHGGKRRRYRVERELKRKNAVQSLKVYEYEDGKPLCVADGVREGNALLERAVGLEQKDFEKCIALPQGEFSQFVRSQRAERLKLVARLFDLERFGENLIKRTNSAYQQAKTEADVVRARLEPYAEVSEENNRALAEEISESERALAEYAKRKEELSLRERAMTSQAERYRERQALSARMTALESAEGEIALLERELARLKDASNVIRANGECKAAEEEEANCLIRRRKAEEALQDANKAEERASLWNFERAEEEINALTETRARAQARKETEGRLREAEERLKATRLEFASLCKLFQDFDYLACRDALDRQMSELGEISFNTKAALFRDEYATFCKELAELIEQFPEIYEVAEPIRSKYRQLSEGERTDFAKFKRELERRDALQRELNEKSVALEKRNGSYKAHREKLQQLQTEGERLKREIQSLQSSLDDGTPPIAQIEETLAALRAERKRHSDELNGARDALLRAREELAAARSRTEAAQNALSQAATRLDDALKAGDFACADEAIGLTQRFGQADGARERARSFREEYAAVSSRLEAVKDVEEVTQESLDLLREELKRTESAEGETAKTLAVKRDALERASDALTKKNALTQELLRATERAGVFERLQKLISGNKFMEYVAEEHLGAVAFQASKRLLSLTEGRYFLRYEGGFFVGDNFDGGNLRGVYTLSGGETFLVSLSLALALSAQICARSLRPAEFFFLDEGFGTLDAKLVDTVMDSLEKLKSENFSIGIISHVDELKHRIGRKLTVKRATPQHGSQILSE